MTPLFIVFLAIWIPLILLLILGIILINDDQSSKEKRNKFNQTYGKIRRRQAGAPQGKYKTFPQRIRDQDK